jgi:hypothetical protein
MMQPFFGYSPYCKTTNGYEGDQRADEACISHNTCARTYQLGRISGRQLNETCWRDQTGQESLREEQWESRLYAGNAIRDVLEVARFVVQEILKLLFRCRVVGGRTWCGSIMAVIACTLHTTSML